jgi:hypothetical protein
MKYRMLWAAATTGLAIHLAGLGWDVYRHSSDSSLAEREDVLSLANPSHAMIIAGMAIVAVALLGMAVIWMNDRKFAGNGPVGLALRSVALPVIGLSAAGIVWLASTSEDHSHTHEHDDATVLAHLDSHIAVTDASGGAGAESAAHDHSGTTAGAAAGTETMGEASAHTHGAEVAVSSAQLKAADAFVAELKAHTAQFQDVRAAMADGYVQITQDLPGIAAHFIRLDYQHDGHEMDPDRPEVLLYTKRLDGNWKLVGAMMLAENVSSTPPSYFGALDAWHFHENLCFTAGSQVSVTASQAECKNGLFVKQTAYQMHVWLTGEESGIFAHDYAPISPGAFPPATKPAAEEFRVQAR